MNDIEKFKERRQKRIDAGDVQKFRQRRQERMDNKSTATFRKRRDERLRQRRHDGWITVHPKGNDRDEEGKGVRIYINDKTKVVEGGAGGALNGKKFPEAESKPLDELKQEQEQKKAEPKPQEPQNQPQSVEEAEPITNTSEGGNVEQAENKTSKPLTDKETPKMDVLDIANTISQYPDGTMLETDGGAQYKKENGKWKDASGVSEDSFEDIEVASFMKNNDGWKINAEEKVASQATNFLTPDIENGMTFEQKKKIISGYPDGTKFTLNDGHTVVKEGSQWYSDDENYPLLYCDDDIAFKVWATTGWKFSDGEKVASEATNPKSKEENNASGDLNSSYNVGDKVLVDGEQWEKIDDGEWMNSVTGEVSTEEFAEKLKDAKKPTFTGEELKKNSYEDNVDKIKKLPDGSILIYNTDKYVKTNGNWINQSTHAFAHDTSVALAVGAQPMYIYSPEEVASEETPNFLKAGDVSWQDDLSEVAGKIADYPVGTTFNDEYGNLWTKTKNNSWNNSDGDVCKDENIALSMKWSNNWKFGAGSSVGNNEPKFLTYKDIENMTFGDVAKEIEKYPEGTIFKIEGGGDVVKTEDGWKIGSLIYSNENIAGAMKNLGTWSFKKGQETVASESNKFLTPQKIKEGNLSYEDVEKEISKYGDGTVLSIKADDGSEYIFTKKYGAWKKQGNKLDWYDYELASLLTSGDHDEFSFKDSNGSDNSAGTTNKTYYGNQSIQDTLNSGNVTSQDINNVHKKLGHGGWLTMKDENGDNHWFTAKWDGGFTDETKKHYSKEEVMQKLNNGWTVTGSSGEAPNYKKGMELTGGVDSYTGTPSKAFAKSKYSQDAKNNAIWIKDEFGMSSFDAFSSVSSNVWKKATKKQKEAIALYTGSKYLDYNNFLRGKGNYLSQSEKDDINGITKLINKSSYNENIWLQRGSDVGTIGFMFGNPDFDYMSHSEKEKYLDSLIADGAVGKEKGFASCGSAKGSGFTSKDMIMNIYCPSGTKMIYAEPFSHYGKSCSYSNWDGNHTGQSGVSGENEMILQQGTQFKVTKYEYKSGKWYVDLEVVGQEPNEV